jgi:hypothetical protein
MAPMPPHTSSRARHPSTTSVFPVSCWPNTLYRFAGGFGGGPGG